MARFQAQVVVVWQFATEAASQADAELRIRRMAYSRQRVTPDDIRTISVLPMTEAQELDDRNICVWQETEALALGTSNQRQRWASGCLPDVELLQLVRAELFRPFALCPRRTRKGPSAVAHPTDASGAWLCAQSAINGVMPVAWATRPDPSLADEQWVSLQRILAASDEVRRHRWMVMRPPTCVRIEIREHRGTCNGCHAGYSESAALVEIDWAGRALSREYTL